MNGREQMVAVGKTFEQARQILSDFEAACTKRDLHLCRTPSWIDGYYKDVEHVVDRKAASPDKVVVDAEPPVFRGMYIPGGFLYERLQGDFLECWEDGFFRLLIAK